MNSDEQRDKRSTDCTFLHVRLYGKFFKSVPVSRRYMSEYRNIPFQMLSVSFISIYVISVFSPINVRSFNTPVE